MSIPIIGPAEIEAMIDREVAGFATDTRARAGTLAEFQQARRTPRLVTVNFSGGITSKCYSVTRPNGDYRVIYLPLAGYFSLCVESDFGPLDIGVHGPAIACFGSV
ncbi:hypothetical protein [Aestuariivita sp.]|uniref:hypothetical protein n=1 Tax=Aestuariivita sp. TaxID=1872407 RepID=UPI00216C7C03|nr:hypothetical protein [Aestuariivita sp.]MCE8009470.1 hypothetical protein [Aestuariivita sp.]